MMQGVAFQTTARGLLQARRILDKLSYLDTRDLLDHVGSEVESQTRRRISTEKTSPEGTPWKELSHAYAEWKKKHSRGGLLVLFGHLRDSITYVVEGDSIRVGSNLVYSSPHQETRPFLGLSNENDDAIERLTKDWLRKIMGASI